MLTLPSTIISYINTSGPPENLQRQIFMGKQPFKDGTSVSPEVGLHDEVSILWASDGGPPVTIRSHIGLHHASSCCWEAEYTCLKVSPYKHSTRGPQELGLHEEVDHLWGGMNVGCKVCLHLITRGMPPLSHVLSSLTLLATICCNQLSSSSPDSPPAALRWGGGHLCSTPNGHWRPAGGSPETFRWPPQSPGMLSHWWVTASTKLKNIF